MRMKNRVRMRVALGNRVAALVTFEMVDRKEPGDKSKLESAYSVAHTKPSSSLSKTTEKEEIYINTHVLNLPIVGSSTNYDLPA